MKRIQVTIKSVAMLFVSVAVFAFTPVHAADKTVRLVTGTDYAPYTSRELPEAGVVSEVVKRVFKEAGYKPNLEFRPWKRAFKGVLLVKFDATFPYAYSEERAAQFHYSRPVNWINIRTFYNRDKPIDYSRPSDLKDLTYCQPLGYQTEPELDKMIIEDKLLRIEATDMDACFRLLAVSRVDFVVSNDRVAWEAAIRALGDNAKETVAAAETPFRQIQEFVIISRQNPNGEAMINAFNENYAKLEADGAIQEIWLNRIGTYPSPAF